MSNKRIQTRIMYHKSCMSDCEDHVRGIWTTYEAETRKGLDEYQSQTLLSWRKEEIAKSSALRDFHQQEMVWLAILLKEVNND